MRLPKLHKNDDFFRGDNCMNNEFHAFFFGNIQVNVIYKLLNSNIINILCNKKSEPEHFGISHTAIDVDVHSGAQSSWLFSWLTFIASIQAPMVTSSLLNIRKLCFKNKRMQTLLETEQGPYHHVYAPWFSCLLTIGKKQIIILKPQLIFKV